MKEACLNEFTGLSHDELLHSSLLIFNEIMRIANFEHETIRQRLTNIAQFNKNRSIIGQNPIEWLLESIQPTIVESRTSRTLVTDYFQMVCVMIY